MSDPQTTKSEPRGLTVAQLLAADGPACLIIKAQFKPLGDQDRFQPAGFPEMGHVIYDAPRADKGGRPLPADTVCIVDSAASMANHLEALCFANAPAGILHADLAGLPYVRCVTDRNHRTEQGKLVLDKNALHDRLVVTTLSEGHRLASDYFLDALVAPGWIDARETTKKDKEGKEKNVAEPAHWEGESFRSKLRREFKIVEVKKDKTYFVAPDDWWTIFETIFHYDPNSLVHGILFAKEQIKISRLLTAHLEAFGARRVGSAGVKFDRLDKTTSGQPIFSRDEETAQRIVATFLVDVGMLRSYGHDEQGLNDAQKRLLLELALWKVQRMLAAPFRFRSGCHLACVEASYATEDGMTPLIPAEFGLDISAAIKGCAFGTEPVTNVYYPANELFNPESSSDVPAAGQAPPEGDNEDDQPEV
ncbi:MAG: type I-U CRISPR-associated protein Cas7 [Verrucomicrobiota bacterium]|jgi:CRISPR-associated protein Csb1